ncbi:MAG: OmpH family outer membrane protein [Bacteroidales bacterium]|nr:OmpH family outer membrane protein [Bacteroidales bacterium]
MGELENENMEKEVLEVENDTCEKKKKCKCCCCRYIIDGVLILAVIGLYILYFFFPKTGSKAIVPVAEGTPRSGEIVYINVDSINANYELVNMLTDDIDAEMAKQEAIFTNRQNALERKAAQFQQNYQSGILTQVQIENAQQQLMQESETLKQDYARVMGDLENRQAAALKQITDSVIAVTQRVNSARNASFVLSYQYGSPVIDADPTKDITNEVLEILNEPYKKKR